MNSEEENIIRDMYQRERTYIGKSVLKQLAEALNMDLGDKNE